jgi:ketosteroid isomerase-like protein
MEMAAAQSARASEWIPELFQTTDAMDAEAFAAGFTEDGTFRLGNADPAVGRQQVQQFVQGLFSSIGGLSHKIIAVTSGTWQMGKMHIVELEVVYARRDGTQTEALAAVTIIRMKGNRIRDYRVFIDASPLFAAAA